MSTPAPPPGPERPGVPHDPTATRGADPGAAAAPGDRQPDRATDPAAGTAAGTATGPAEALAGAAAALRSHTDPGWEQVRPGLLATALAAFRPSDPARGQHDLGTFWVSSDVVVQRLGRVVEAVPGARAERITCVTGDLDLLQRVDAQIAADYGTGLQRVADEVRRAVEAELRVVLGDPVDDAGAVLPPTEVNVHVVDVTWDADPALPPA